MFNDDDYLTSLLASTRIVTSSVRLGGWCGRGFGWCGCSGSVIGRLVGWLIGWVFVWEMGVDPVLETLVGDFMPLWHLVNVQTGCYVTLERERERERERESELMMMMMMMMMPWKDQGIGVCVCVCMYVCMCVCVCV